MQIEIKKVKITKRIRNDLGNIDGLMDSLARFGLFHPININSKNELVSGFRRLESAKRLGWLQIDANIVETTRESFLERELEENLLRKDFTDSELQEAYKRLRKIQNPNFFQKIIKAISTFFYKLFNKKRPK